MFAAAGAAIRLQSPVEGSVPNVNEIAWQRVKSVFDAAVEHQGAARAAFLDQACGDDRTLRSEVESLLGYHTSTDGVLDTPPVNTPFAPDTGDPLIGTLVGPYRVIDRIGQGGMGTVYRATRADGSIDRFVALKVIRTGMATADLVRRFHEERQALAGLDHPGIARLFDGGTTESGLPYLVMEYVDGIPIDRYCDQHRLSLDARLRLFRTICQAVHYAHQHLIVHRDLKPDNILVTAEGTAKLLDFGVAKIQGPRIEVTASNGGRVSTRLMTPDYASPEQTRGEAITTSSDVFSLGVLLYELLTGRKPFDLATSSLAEIERVICSEDPPPPSVMVGQRPRGDHAAAAAMPDTIASHRNSTVRALQRALAGDLDTIVAMAMRKEPQRRYPTVEHFSNDVRQHLRGLPVVARRDTLGYRASKFIRRNRGPVVAGALVGAALVAGVLSTAWQAEVAQRERARAERRSADARRLATGFMFEVYDALVNVPGTTQARSFMVQDAIRYLDNLASEAAGDVALRRELAAAYSRVAEVQGHPTSANIGDTTGSRASYEKSIGLLAAILRDAPDDHEARRLLAMAHRRLADVLAFTGDVDEALKQTRVSLAEYAQLADAPMATPEDAFQRGVAYIKLGDTLGNEVFPNAGDADGALRAYDAALSWLEPLAAKSPDDERTQRYLGIVFERRGQIHETANRYAEALVEYERSLELRAALAARNPLHLDIQRDHAIAHEKIGNVLLARGDVAEALDRYRRSLKTFESLYQADTANVGAARSLGVSAEKLAHALVRAGDDAEARDLRRRAADLYRTIGSRDPSNTQFRGDLARVEADLAQP